MGTAAGVQAKTRPKPGTRQGSPEPKWPKSDSSPVSRGVGQGYSRIGGHGEQFICNVEKRREARTRGARGKKRLLLFGDLRIALRLGRLTGMKFTLRDKCVFSTGLRTRASFGSSKPEELAMDGPKAE
jgi:hypothetical protein